MPIIRISGASALETNNIAFVITLSEAAVDAVSVNYRTLLAGTANDGDLSYASTTSTNNGTVTFAPGETTKTIYVDSYGDSADEFDEHIVVELFNPTANGTFDNDAPVAKASGVILDNDGAGSNLAMFVSDPVIIEGDSGQKVAEFEVRLSRPATTAFSASYSTKDGSALAGVDYLAQSGTVVFSIGQDVAKVQVPILGDSLAEALEKFQLVVTPPSSPVINSAGAVGEATIIDADTSPLTEISVDDAATLEGNYLRFVVTLSAPPIDAVSVSYRLLPAGTAVPADLSYDFTSSNNNNVLVFSPGQTTASIFIDTYGDSLDERDEHVTLELFNPSSNAVFAGSTPVARATGIVQDNDGAGSNLAVFVSDPVIVEGDSDTRQALFEIRLSQPAPAAFDMTYTTIDGSAWAGQDYTATSGTLSFSAGQEYAWVSVPILGGVAPEALEMFSLVVSPPSNPSIGTTGAVGEAAIMDTDTSAKPELSIQSALTQEGDYLRFVVSLSEAAADAVTVNYRTLLSGTATDADLSYHSTSNQNNGTITFSPGQTSASIFIDTYSESLDERDEHVTVELFGHSANATFSGSEPALRANGVILDNDGAGSNLAFIVSDPVLVEEHSGQKLVLFEVRLSQPAPTAFSTTYTTKDGTAIAGLDYVATSGTLQFAAGQEYATVAVAVNGDTLAEMAEHFSLVVTPPGSPSIGTDGAVGEATIIDTDTVAGPEISIEGDSVVEGGYLRFVVTLSEPSLEPVQVSYLTAVDGTAVNTDLAYSNLESSQNRGILTFSPGETTKSIFIDTSSDSLDERDESLTMALYNAVGAAFSGGEATTRATGFILDNDGAGLNIALGGAPFVVTEKGKAVTRIEVPVELSQPSASELTFQVSAIDAGATANVDYDLVSSSLTFAPGQTKGAVSAYVYGDSAVEALETFQLSFSAPPEAPIAGTIPNVVVSILNGPAHYTVSHAPVAFTHASFAPGAGGWVSMDTYPRVFADVNGDGYQDVVGFGYSGTIVSMGTGNGAFNAEYVVLSNFGAGPAGGGWATDNTYPRELGDINGDGRADVVGFGDAGVYIAHGQIDGTFGAVSYLPIGFGAGAAGGHWLNEDRYPRELGDVNGDGRDDIVGFGGSGVYVALSNGDGTFGPTQFVLQAFGGDAAGGGWASDNRYPRRLADMDGDGDDDIIGFGEDGVYVARSNGDGTFAAPTLILNGFGAGALGGGWANQTTFPRQLADINGDGADDIIGFGGAGAYAALSNGEGGFETPALITSNFGAEPGAGSWVNDTVYPRFVTDLNGDHYADIVGIGHAGLYVSMTLIG